MARQQVRFILQRVRVCYAQPYGSHAVSSTSWRVLPCICAMYFRNLTIVPSLAASFLLVPYLSNTFVPPVLLCLHMAVASRALRRTGLPAPRPCSILTLPMHHPTMPP